MIFALKPLKTPKAKSTITPKKTIIEKNIVGVVVETIVDSSMGVSVFQVMYNDKTYDIPKNCFDTKGKRKVYVKDNKGHYIEFDRCIKEDRRPMPPCYMPFIPNHECIGNIIDINGKEYFKIKGSYNPSNKDYKEKIIKEINESDSQNC